MRPHARATGRAGGRAAALAVATAGLLLVAGPATAQDADDQPGGGAGGDAAEAPDDGLDEVGTTTWRVDPAGGRVTATIDLALRNTVPDTDAGRTYFDAYGIALPMPPTAVTVRLGDDEVDADVGERDDGTLVLDWDFPSRLFHDETQQYRVKVAWDSAPPRTDFDQGPRVTEAFVLTPVWAWGRDDAVVEVRVPDALAPRLGRAEPDRVRDGVAVFRRDDAANLSQFLVGASDAGERTTREVEVDGTTVAVEAWPDDPDWSRRVADFAGQALPELAAWTSTPFGDDRLTIRETARPIAEGWGGWNDPEAGTISVGEAFDRSLWTHELAHDWFDQEQFTDTWLLEGLTEEATESLADDLDIESPPEPAPTDRALLDWWDILEAADRDLVEDPDAWYAVTNELYAGAHHVVDTVADEVGEDTFRELVRMTLQDESAWGDLGRPPDPAADWREFLDLAERVGGSTTARDLVLTNVVPDAGDLLAERDRAIEAYDDLADHPWGVPTSVSASMHEWRFDTIDDQVTEAQSARESVEALAARADERGWTVPDLEEAWRTEDLEVVTARVDALDEVLDDVEQLESQAAEAGLPRPALAVDLAAEEADTATRRVVALRRSIDDVVGAEQTLDAVEDDPVASVGLAGTDPQVLRDQARRAFADGDVPAVQQAVADLESAVDGATERGRLRIGAGVGLVVALLALVVALVWFRRRHRDRDPVPTD